MDKTVYYENNVFKVKDSLSKEEIIWYMVEEFPELGLNPTVEEKENGDLYFSINYGIKAKAVGLVTKPNEEGINTVYARYETSDGFIDIPYEKAFPLVKSDY